MADPLLAEMPDLQTERDRLEDENILLRDKLAAAKRTIYALKWERTVLRMTLLRLTAAYALLTRWKRREQQAARQRQSDQELATMQGRLQ